MCKTVQNTVEVMCWYQQYITFHFTGGRMPSIPGPSCSPEQTESFPLKPGGAGNRANGWRSVTRCFGGSADLQSGSGLRILVLCFVVITLAVVIALAVQIYYGDYQVSKHVLFAGWSAASN
jgi:hypothetical protein